MWEKDSDFRPELLWREGKAFLNIEERALAYRKLYMQNADESRTETQIECIQDIQIVIL